MAHDTVFVGLDYHQQSIQVCVLSRSGKVLRNSSCKNSLEAVERTAKRNRACNVHVAVEACCGSANLADELVDRLGWSVSLAHPGYVSRMKQSPDKSDYSDARMLADLLRVGYLPKVWLAPEYIRELRHLVRYREQLTSQRRAAKLRIRALLREQRLRHATASPWTKAWLRWLRSEAMLTQQSRWVIEQHLEELDTVVQKIKETEKRIATMCAEDSLIKFLQTLPGIGFVTAVTLRAEIGRFDRFATGKQLSRFCGLSPRNASSGERQADAGLIKAGRPYLRTVLIEAAHRLMRYELRWAKLAHRLRSAGKPGSVAAAAVANRWVRWLHHQVRSFELAA
jgi:transposase